MPIEIRPGLLYIFKTADDGMMRELVGGLRSAGYRFLVVSARAPEAVKEDLDMPLGSILTLTESVGQNCVDPQNLMVLTDSITKFTERAGPSAFLIEDLAALTHKNEFPKVLRMIGFVCESLAISRAIGIVVVDPLTLDRKDMAYLGKEGRLVEEKDRLDLRAVTARGAQENRPSQNV